MTREAHRQQALLRALWRDAPDAVLAGWMRESTQVGAGLQAYRANAGAHAERALAAAYPTLQQLLGNESFAALARAHWQADPPLRGDLAWWGAGLAAFIADAAQLAADPYLADMARLDWAVHQAAQAADAQDVQGLSLLAQVDPQHLRLRLQPGCALLVSAFPVATIWRAHHGGADPSDDYSIAHSDNDRDDADPFAAARAALAARQAESAWVQRQGWRVQVRALPAAEARFTRALLQRLPLADALQAAGADFSFETWLIAALQNGAIAAAEEMP